MNETQLQMETLLCHDAYSEGFIRVGYKRHLGVGMFNLLALSLSLVETRLWSLRIPQCLCHVLRTTLHVFRQTC